MSHHKYFINNNTALAGVIEALLLVALVSIILSTIQLYYVPMIMEQKESDHMDDVLNEFSQLKSVVEMQSMMGISSSSKPIVHSPMSSPITLGNDNLPYFISSRSYGQISVNDKINTGNNKLVIRPPVPGFNDGIPLTSIYFDAQNFYFVDQDYILEGGGVIVNQSSDKTENGEVMSVYPAITAKELSNSIKIDYTIPVFVSKPGKNKSYYGYKPVFLRTNYTKHYNHTDSNIINISIYSDHLIAWNQTLRHNSSGILWEFCNSEYINVTYEYDRDLSRTYLLIEPSDEPTGKNIDVVLTIVEIGVQVGPGFRIN